MKIKVEEFSNDWLSYEFVKTIDIKPLEFHKGSIVTQGFILDEIWKPTYILFKTRDTIIKVKVINTLITPKIAVLYVDKDPRSYPYTEGYELYCDRQWPCLDNDTLS